MTTTTDAPADPAAMPTPDHDDPVFAARRRFGRVAISHEWLTVPGGSEQVVLALLDLFPSAELFTSVYDPAPWPRAITDRPVHASFLDRLPGARRHYRPLLPLMNRAFRSFDLDAFDLVISSNHASAKNVRAHRRPGQVHVCYCHTPMRYAWEPEFLAGELGPSARRAAAPVLAHLRRVDRRAGRRPDVIVANSRHVADRVSRYYGRHAVVVHPPVEVDRFLGVPRTQGDYYLVLGRVVPYKRAEVAVAACARLGRPVVVAGEGRALDAARAAAGPDATFLGRVPDADLPGLLAGARALLFCGEEDFGIVPVEAQAAGVPVIALDRGGVRDTVIDGETGVLYPDSRDLVDAARAAILDFEARTFDEARIRAHAAAFGPARFAREMATICLEAAT